MEAAGIEPTPGGAKPLAESRPYLVTARNASESISLRVPSCPALFQAVPQAPATYVQHGGGCPPPAVRPSRAVWLTAVGAVLERAARSRWRSPVPGLLRQGASALSARSACVSALMACRSEDGDEPAMAGRLTQVRMEAWRSGFSTGRRAVAWGASPASSSPSWEPSEHGFSGSRSLKPVPLFSTAKPRAAFGSTSP